jgi:hypothetical protein
MKLANLSTRGLPVSGIARLLVMFEVFDTEAEAVKSVAYPSEARRAKEAVGGLQPAELQSQPP